MLAVIAGCADCYCRLPIVQASTLSFLVPTFAILSLPKWKCPSPAGKLQQNYCPEYHPQLYIYIYVHGIRTFCSVYIMNERNNELPKGSQMYSRKSEYFLSHMWHTSRFTQHNRETSHLNYLCIS